MPKQVQAATQGAGFAEAQRALEELMRAQTISMADDETIFLARALEIIRLTGPEQLDKVAARYPDFLRAFFHDSTWMGQYLNTNCVPAQTELPLMVLGEIWMAYGRNATDSHAFLTYRGLACALAIVWGSKAADSAVLYERCRERYNPLWRFQYFRTMHMEGRLHQEFAKLRPWELFFVVGSPGDDMDDASLMWCARNLTLPWDKYHEAAQTVRQADCSPFGDEAGTHFFSVPFDDLSDAAALNKLGVDSLGRARLGVCAARAHGIPAFFFKQENGEYGFAVRPRRGSWQSSSPSISGEMSNFIFSNQAPGSYITMEHIFADDSRAVEAARCAIVSRACEAVGDAKGELAFLRQALEYTPTHPAYLSENHRLMLAQDASAQEWLRYEKWLLPQFAGNAYAALASLKEVEPSVLPKLNIEQRFEWFATFQNVLASTPAMAGFDIKALLTSEMLQINESPEKEQAFLELLIKLYTEKGDGSQFVNVMEWTFEYCQRANLQEILENSIALASKGLRPDGSNNALSELRRQRVLAGLRDGIMRAAVNGLFNLFNTLTDVAAACSPEGHVIRMSASAVREMSGTIVVPELLVKTSSSTPSESFETHRSIRSESGGLCRTDAEAEPFIELMYEKPQLVKELAFRKDSSCAAGMRAALVEVTEDGFLWKQIASTENMPDEWVVSFPAIALIKGARITMNNGDKLTPMALTHFLTLKR